MLEAGRRIVLPKRLPRRRDFIRDALAGMESKRLRQTGLYIFAKIPESYGQDDVAFAENLAEQARVGGTPGSAFGAGGEGYIRFSYAASDEKLSLAMSRMKQFIETAVTVD